MCVCVCVCLSVLYGARSELTCMGLTTSNAICPTMSCIRIATGVHGIHLYATALLYSRLMQYYTAEYAMHIVLTLYVHAPSQHNYVYYTNRMYAMSICMEGVWPPPSQATPTISMR